MSFRIWDISVLILAFKGEAFSKGSEVMFSFLAWFPKEMRVMPLLSVYLSLFFSHIALQELLGLSVNRSQNKKGS